MLSGRLIWGVSFFQARLKQTGIKERNYKSMEIKINKEIRDYYEARGEEL